MLLQLCHCVGIVGWQRQPWRDGARVNDGQCHSAPSSNQVKGQDGDVKVIPAGGTATSSVTTMKLSRWLPDGISLENDVNDAENSRSNTMNVMCCFIYHRHVLDSQETSTTERKWQRVAEIERVAEREKGSKSNHSCCCCNCCSNGHLLLLFC
jgi:hypothetical protein